MTMETVRDAVLPVLSAYLFFVVLLAVHARDRRRPPTGEATRPPTWRELIRYLAVLVTMGYLVLLAIVFVFYPLLGATTPRALLTQAVGYGALLAFGVALPLFLLLTYVDRRRMHRS
jgi:uncharacterized membrane protein